MYIGLRFDESHIVNNVSRRHIGMSAIINIVIFRSFSVSNFLEYESLLNGPNNRRSFFAWHEHANTSPTFYATDPFSPARSIILQS